jgi:cytochrome c oxidase subunit 2
VALGIVASLALIFGVLVWSFGYTPQSGGSPNADEIASLYKLTLGLAMVVFVAVEVSLVYALWRFKARRGKVAAQIRGNTNLEISWTVGAALILVVLTVFTFLKLPAIRNPARSGPGGLRADGMLYAQVDQPQPPGGQKLNVCVNGQQYVWRFTYSSDCSQAYGKAYSYTTMVVPVNTTVTLNITAQDVQHSWWIPKLGGKFDGYPGYTNHTWFKIAKPGTYDGQCAELCGRGHANMVARVRAVPVAEYEAWVARQKQLIDTANKAAAAQRRSVSPIPSTSDTNPSG